jgi:hypothetical protein
MLHKSPTAVEMPEGQLPADRMRPDGTVVHSLTAHALYAIDRHKWIESEKNGRDLGDSAVDEWTERYWRGWARARLMEHLYGWRCWGAFGEDDFGLLNRATVDFHVHRHVLEKVSSLLAAGGENLDVISWALTSGEPLEPILWLLNRIDINSKRSQLITDHIRLFTRRNSP